MVLLWSSNLANPARITVLSVARYATPNRGCHPLYFGSQNVCRTFGCGNAGGKATGSKNVPLWGSTAESLLSFQCAGATKSYRIPKLTLSFLVTCHLSCRYPPNQFTVKSAQVSPSQPLRLSGAPSKKLAAPSPVLFVKPSSEVALRAKATDVFRLSS